jgi:hypothetical protein
MEGLSKEEKEWPIFITISIVVGAIFGFMFGIKYGEKRYDRYIRNNKDKIEVKVVYEDSTPIDTIVYIGDKIIL